MKKEITENQFLKMKALRYAKHKQAYIYRMTKNPVVLQHWYLVKLTEEYARNLTFSNFTMDLCETLLNMEKEHSANCQSAQMDIHIVNYSDQ